MTIRRRVVTAVVCLGSSVLIITCGPSGMEAVGDAMIETGTALRDAASDDASAQMTYDGTCVEETRTATQTYADGRSATSTVTHWTATVSVPGLDPATVTDVMVIACDYQDLTMTGTVIPDCPTGATCTGTTFPGTSWLVERCLSGDAQLSAGRMSFACGARTAVHSVAADGTATDYTTGLRWGSVRFVVRQ